ncbi:hypothetical protein AMECASPLE_027889 [Ameca splendens]|uniref:Uncharacterized protein n=1 Tax=Ameca splendens TaxID=208324 RepID=A0ABV0ZQ62_9TELE
MNVMKAKVSIDDLGEPLTEKVIENPPSYGELLNSFKENLFKFILKCREKNHLPVSVQEEIVDDVNFLMCFFKNYDAFIGYHMQKSGFDISKSPELESVIHYNDLFSKATKAIQSPYLMKNHCKSKLNMTEPIHCKLRNSVGQTVGSYPYVPIDKVLKNYCSHDDIQDNIFSEHNPEMDSEFLKDYCDGSIFRQHPFFKAHPNALRYILGWYIFMKMNSK